jgi:predicted dehydrogenase
MKNRIAFIGSGKVSKFHIDAALEAGFTVTAISATDKSKSALELSKKYSIANYFEQTEELLNSNTYDCISVVTPPDISAKLIGLISKKNIPAIIEKPGALNSISLNEHTQNKNIFVAYNRRYYKTIYELESIKTNNPGVFQFSVVELSDLSSNFFLNIESNILKNSVHMLDLLIYLIGKCDLRDPVYSEINHNLNCRIFHADKYIGNINLSFNSKKNTSIEFENSDLNMRISPLERLQISNSFKVIPPEQNYAYTKYKNVFDKLSEPSEVIESGNLKPGFLGQYLDFYQFCNSGVKPKKLASLADAENVLKLAEHIIELYKKYTKN